MPDLMLGALIALPLAVFAFVYVLNWAHREGVSFPTSAGAGISACSTPAAAAWAARFQAKGLGFALCWLAIALPPALIWEILK